MSDWQVGDLAVCVDAERRFECPVPSPLVAGAVYTVSGIDPEPDDDGQTGLYLVEVSIPRVVTKDSIWCDSFAEPRFRKIRPDEHEACEPEFVTLLKRTKRKVAA